MREVIIGVDIGGSHVGVCLLHRDPASRFPPLGMVGQPLTNREVSYVIDSMYSLISRLMEKNADCVISAIGVGCPGQPQDGVVVAASNFPTWKDVPLVNLVKKRFPGVFVCLLKDSDAALAGEIWGENSPSYGPTKNAVMITLGTGIGVSLLINGSFHSGSSGLVEGGHMIIDRSPSATICGCGQRGCAEVFASASNLVRQFKDAGGAMSNQMGAADIFRLIDAPFNGDSNGIIAEAVVSEASDALSVLVINLCRVVDPEIIIFAGGMSRAGEKLLSRVRRDISKRAWTCLPQNTPLAVAMSEDAGCIGAAVFAYRKKSENEAIGIPASKDGTLTSKRRSINAGVCLVTGFIALAIFNGKKYVSSNCPLFSSQLAIGMGSVSIYSCWLYLCVY